MRKRIDGKPYVIDVMKEIAAERKRLERHVSSSEYKKKPQWSWMKNWLAKTDIEHFNHEYNMDDPDTYYTGSIDNKYCNICGEKNRFLMSIDFSFCDEYDCGIDICSKCLKMMLKTLKEVEK